MKEDKKDGPAEGLEKVFFVILKDRDGEEYVTYHEKFEEAKGVFFEATTLHRADAKLIEGRVLVKHTAPTQEDFNSASDVLIHPPGPLVVGMDFGVEEFEKQVLGKLGPTNTLVKGKK